MYIYIIFYILMIYVCFANGYDFSTVFFGVAKGSRVAPVITGITEGYCLGCSHDQADHKFSAYGR